MLADPECVVPEAYKKEGMRSNLAVPLLKNDQLIGAIAIHRTEVRPFTDAQIKLVSTFADQAVIAIENVRLFNELEARNRDLTEALEQQTATSEILRVIASSPTDIQPVLDTVAETAARLCNARDASIFRFEDGVLKRVAIYGSNPTASNEELVARTTPMGRAFVDRKILHIHDLAAEVDSEFPASKTRQHVTGSRSVLASPLLREGVSIGVIWIRRMEVKPFTDSQVKLLETFAAQAVIAIENVRLFQELKESLEQQTATSEILGVIASSPTDIQPVLDVVAENAARLCDALDAVIYRIDGEAVQPVAHHGPVPLGQGPRPLVPGFPVSRAILERQTLHIPDLAAAMEEYPNAQIFQRQVGIHTLVVTPLLREGVAIGAISLRRQEVRPFSEKQIALLKTFADQSVIAIENVRLFQELRESLERQTATSEILRVIASSPTDLQPVFDAIAEKAARLCGAEDALVRRVDGDLSRLAAHFGSTPTVAVLGDEVPVHDLSVAGRAVRERRTMHVHDLQTSEAEFPGARERGIAMGVRTALAVPLLRDGEPIGVIHIRRLKVQPFTDSQVHLVETFADQAVIAIENVRLFHELEARNRDLTEALEQQTATSEILRVIASSPTNIQPVLDTVAESAARLCGAEDAVIHRMEGGVLRRVAAFGELPTVGPLGGESAIDRSKLSGRAVFDKRTIHVSDIETEVDREFSGEIGQLKFGVRTMLSTPLMREGVAIGVINIRRRKVQPFTDTQVHLVETFADQAVIAIENVRLFLELKESLEQQTATSEILGVIARSPTDIQPVLNVVAENAARLCDSIDAQIYRVDGDIVRRVASHGSIPVPAPIANVQPVDRGWIAGRAVLDRQTVHVHDIQSDSVAAEYPLSKGYAQDIGAHTILATPLLRESIPIGAILIRRLELRPFTDKQIALLKTFADQAVIAIENVRLFNELERRNRDLTEALEQQTATSEVLKVISRSTFDLQPVLQTLIENAARLCGADQGFIYRVDGELYRPAACHNVSPEQRAWIEEHPISPGTGTVIGRVGLHHRAVHIPDALADSDYTYAAPRMWGQRTLLGVPMLREGICIGAFSLHRQEAKAFTDKQIELVTTFADQAVIAIENVRLFNELEARNSELRESLEYQTATGEILRVIASSPTDIQPVLDVVAENAARLCEADDAQIMRLEGDLYHRVASFGTMPALAELALNRQSPSGRAMVDRKTIHVLDLAAEVETEYPEIKTYQKHLGHRTTLATPLLREGAPIGAILIRRLQVRPFSEKQIKLLETFADQAVIAIENVRLFNELEARNMELRESLEHQTAAAEVLGIISRSPTDVQPVLNAIVESAARVCGIDDIVLRLVEGNSMAARAHVGFIPVRRVEIEMDAPHFAWMREHGALHIPDVRAKNDFPRLGAAGNYRTILAVPLRQRGELVGEMYARRTEVLPFTPAQIKLLETFADQAVIAIENVRLFHELEARNTQLRESLEHQTATAEVLGIISRSPTDVQPVFDAIVESAARVCSIDDVVLRLREGEVMIPRAHFGAMPITRTEVGVNEPMYRWLNERGMIHVPDVREQNELGDAGIRGGWRTLLAVPLRQHTEMIGSLNARRVEVRPFTPAQAKLLETFADQAVIAIENVRLFQELDARTKELARSVEELKALGEVGQAVSSTLDLETVLSTIVSRAVELSGTAAGIVYEYDEESEEFHLRATYRMEEELVEAYRGAPIRLGQGATGRAAATKEPVDIADLLNDREQGVTVIRPILRRLGYQSLLAVPLLLEKRLMGALTVYRRVSGDFAPEVVKLLQTFATQSVLAIQNARLFREIEEKGREIEAANRHKSEFLANVSHELRTPLNAIIGFSEVLQEKMFGELNDKQNEYVGDIFSSGRHLLSLINDILDLAKIEAGRMELEVAKFDLPSALENALILVRERVTRRGIKLEPMIDEKLGEFVGDERKIKQILLNLLSNAVKFTPEGGKIQVKAIRGEEAAIISVADTGIGIARNDQDAIFEAFRQVGSDYTRKHEGTGLGLSLTKKFVEMHGGKIWVDSDVGKGATFTFTLPERPWPVN
jgi:GAF domain-containing protein